ncbi:MAG: outer membrane beta-barrel protein [Candidatus Zixiibacteriota bacterium]
MRRGIVPALLVLLVLLAGSTASATGIGVGGFGGVSIPLAQDDGEKGSVFGGHVKLSLGGILGIEPNISFFKNGDWDVEEGITLAGSTFSSVGVNLMLGASGPVTAMRPLMFVGGKYYSEDNDLRETDSRIGWNAGLGLEFGGGPIGVEVRGSFELMTLEGGGSRKWGHITGGVNFYFGAR